MGADLTSHLYTDTLRLLYKSSNGLDCFFFSFFFNFLSFYNALLSVVSLFASCHQMLKSISGTTWQCTSIQGPAVWRPHVHTVCCWSCLYSVLPHYLIGSVRVCKYLYGGHMFTLSVAGFVCIVFCPTVWLAVSEYTRTCMEGTCSYDLLLDLFA